MLKSRAAILVIALICTNCASSAKGFIDREALATQVNITKPVYDDKDIQAAYNKKANLPKPFKLAVYFKPARNETWRWTEDDRALLTTAMQDLRTQGILAEAFPILASMVKDPDDMKSLRLAAAQYHADALLVVTGAGEVKTGLNGLGFTYFLILPAAFVNGSQANTLFMASAAMYDVRNEYLYLAAESEGSSQKRYPALIGTDETDLLTQSKTLALGHLTEELKQMVKATKL